MKSFSKNNLTGIFRGVISKILSMKRICCAVLAFMLLFQNIAYAALSYERADTYLSQYDEILSDSFMETALASESDAILSGDINKRFRVYLDKGDIKIVEEKLSAFDERGESINVDLSYFSFVDIVQADNSIPTANKIVIEAPKANISIKDINFEGSTFIDIKENSDVSLNIEGESKLIGKDKNAALIHVPKSCALKIEGEGKLGIESYKGSKAALIGGAEREENGYISVESGSLKLINHGYGSGIGAGEGAGYNNISINGGSIEASVDMVLSGSCIGSGSGGIGEGVITINGGDISTKGGHGGIHFVNCSPYQSSNNIDKGQIIINGGNININPSLQTCALIAHTVEINGGNINIKAGRDETAIRTTCLYLRDGNLDIDCYSWTCGISAKDEINISGGKLKCIGGSIITGSAMVAASKVRISGGSVYVRLIPDADERGRFVSAIGGESVIISGGSVYAKGAWKGSGIGQKDEKTQIKELIITGGSVQSEGGAYSMSDIGYTPDNKEDEAVYPLNENKERLYPELIENIKESDRASFSVDSKNYPIGESIEGNENAYIYLPEGQHEISYGKEKKNILFCDKYIKKARLRLIARDGLNTEIIKDAYASIYKDNKLYYMGNIKEKIVLPEGKYKIILSAYNYYSREAVIDIKSGKEYEKVIILNNNEVVKTKVSARAMNRKEIMEAGIDPDAKGNEHLFKFKVVLEFAAVKPIEFSYVGRKGGEPANYNIISLPAYGKYESIKVQPINERFFLVIYGHSDWLKEMYDVSLVVSNNSKYEALTNVKAVLNELPKGLSLADMKDKEQKLSVNLNDIPAGGSDCINWYIRGDEGGSYNISGKVTGDMSGGGQSFENTFETKEPIEVLAGKAMHLYITAEDSTYKGDTYNVGFELANVSQKDVNNLSLKLDREVQYVISIKKGTEVKKVFKDEEIKNKKIKVDKLAPGESLHLNFATVIEFESEYIKDPEYILVDKFLKMLEGSTTRIPNTFKIIKGNKPKRVLSNEEFKTLKKCLSEDPVDLLTGQFVWEYKDIELIGREGLEFTREYKTKQDMELREATPDSASINKKGRKELFKDGWISNHDYSLKAGAKKKSIEEKSINKSLDNSDIICFYNKGELSYFIYDKNADKYISDSGSAWEIKREDKNYILDTKFGKKYVFDINGRVLSIVNKDKETQYTYAGEKLTKIENSSGYLELFYDEEGRLTEIIDNAKRRISYEYDEKDRLIRAVNPDGDSFYYVYDEQDRLVEIYDLSGKNYVKNLYDDKNRVVYQKVEDMGEFSYSYDEVKRENFYLRSNGAKVGITYDEKNRITEISNDKGVDSFIYNEKNQRIEETDKNGNRTFYEYDETGELKKIIYPDKSSETYARDEAGNITEITDALGNKTEIKYNEYGQITKVIDPMSNTKVFVYDKDKNLIKEIYEEGIEHIYAVDDRGNIKTYIDGNGNKTTYIRDEAGRIVREEKNGNYIDYTYSEAGKLLSKGDMRGKEVFTHNGNGYISLKIDKKGNKTSYTYNAMNKVTSIEDALSQKILYKYL